MKEYKKLGTIGSGTYGKVYKVRDKKGNLYAMKRFIYEDYITDDIIDDISALKYLEHENIIKIHDVIIEENYVYEILELADYDLDRLINRNLSDFEIKMVIYQIVLAMSYYMNMNILHRDIKPQNILIFKGLKVKLTDFGIAKINFCNVYPETMTNYVETLWYRAPNLLLGDKYYNENIDIWALGCVIYELVTKKVLFYGDSEIDMIHRIFNRFGTPTEETWPEVFDYPDWDQTTFPMYGYQGFTEKKIVSNYELYDLLNLIFDYRNLSHNTNLITKVLEHPYFQDLNPLPYYKLNCSQSLALYDMNLVKIIDIRDCYFYALNFSIKRKLSISTLILGLNIFLRYLPSTTNTSTNKLKLIIKTCLNLANKHSDNNIYGHIDSEYYLFFRKQEEKILTVLDWKIFSPSVYDYLNLLIQYNSNRKEYFYNLMLIFTTDLIYELSLSDIAHYIYNYVNTKNQNIIEDHDAIIPDEKFIHLITTMSEINSDE